MKVAVLADVHGNRWALEAVLKDIQRRAVTLILNLGDSLYGPLAPATTAEVLLGLNIPTVSGNEDRIIIEPTEYNPTLEYVRKSLNAQHFRWIENLEMTQVVHNDLFLCHGSPEQDTEYLLQVVTESGVFLRNTDELLAKIIMCEQTILLCGHDHIPRVIQLPGSRLIVNPGSVGLQAYSDDQPYPHIMETGSPHARYSILSENESGWYVENVAVPYDWNTAAATALENERPDWAQWLKTGRASC